MITEKSILKTEVRFSENKEYRYLLRKEWDSKKKKAMVVMINPSTANDISMDFTTLYTLNNLQNLDFGGVDIVNLYPKITNKLKMLDISEKEIKLNNNLIIELAEKVDTIILAWGKKGENSKKISTQQHSLINLLNKYHEKIFVLGDGSGGSWYHPLAPQVKFNWTLIRLDDLQ